MNVAIFGLVGVLIGGFLNGLVSYLFEQRRQDRAMQAAARLVLDDLLLARARIEAVLQEAAKAKIHDEPLPITECASHREVLASRMGSSRWAAVATIFREIEMLNEDASLGPAQVSRTISGRGSRQFMLG